MSLKHIKMLYGMEHYYTEYLLGIAREQYMNINILVKETLEIKYVSHNAFTVQCMHLIVKYMKSRKKSHNIAPLFRSVFGIGILLGLVKSENAFENIFRIMVFLPHPCILPSPSHFLCLSIWFLHIKQVILRIIQNYHQKF